VNRKRKLETEPTMNTPQHPNAPVLYAILMVMASLVVGCTKKREAHVSGLATVEGEAVSEQAFRDWWSKKTPLEDTPESRREMLDRLIERRALAEAARVAGLEDDPIVRIQIENVLIGRLRETQLAPKLVAVAISDEEVERYYADHREEEFMVPGSVRAAVLWFDTHGQQPMVARYTPRLEAIRSEMLKAAEPIPIAEGFGKLAISNTEHRASRYKGGDLDWIAEGRPASDFHAAVQVIASELTTPGELSPVTARPEGVFLVRLIEKKEAGSREFARVRAKIETKLLAARRAEIVSAFKAKMVAAIGIERFDARLLALGGLAQPRTQSLPNSRFKLDRATKERSR